MKPPPPPPAPVEPPAEPEPRVVAHERFMITPAEYVAADESHFTLNNNTMLVNVYGTVQLLGESAFVFDGMPGVTGIAVAPLNAPIMRGALEVSVTASYVKPAGAALVPGFSDDKYRHLFNFSGARY